MGSGASAFCEIDVRVLGGMQFADFCAGAVLGCCLGCWLRCSSGSDARGAGVQALTRVWLSWVYAGVIIFKLNPFQSLPNVSWLSGSELLKAMRIAHTSGKYFLKQLQWGGESKSN